MKSILVKLSIILSITMSCKVTPKHEGTFIEKSGIVKDSLYLDCVEIAKENEEFKLSCAKKPNVSKLTNKFIYLEIVEPRNIEIDKITVNKNEYLVSFKDETFSYSIELIDQIKGIWYWKNIQGNKTNEWYSFYAIDKKKAETQHLEKQDCSENNNRIKDWIGEYTCTIEATDGETNKEVNTTFKLILTDLNNIEFSNERFEVRIHGDLNDVNMIEGDVTEVIKGKEGFPLDFEPFIQIEKDGDVMLVTCPLMTQGPGFGSTPYAFKKVK
jgi:hypothetical protein